MLLRFGLGPRRRRELFDLGDLGRWQTREQILQIIKGVDAMPPATAQQGVNHRAAFPGFGMPNELPILLSKCAGPNGVLDNDGYTGRAFAAAAGSRFAARHFLGLPGCSPPPMWRHAHSVLQRF